MNFVLFENDRAWAAQVEGIIRREWHVPTALNTKEKEKVEAYLNASTEPTLYLLDIVNESRAGTAEGFDLARQIHQRNRDDQVVFVTSYPLRLVERLDMQSAVLCTIIKPKGEELERFTGQLREAVRLAEARIEKICLIVKDSFSVLNLPFASIATITMEKRRKKAVIYTDNGVYTIRKRLYELREQLDERFVLIHPSAVVNKDWIVRVDRAERYLELKDGQRCEFSYRMGKREGWI